MVIFPLAPDQTIAQMWSNGARGGIYKFQECRSQYSGCDTCMKYRHFIMPSRLSEEHDAQLYASARNYFNNMTNPSDTYNAAKLLFQQQKHSNTFLTSTWCPVKISEICVNIIGGKKSRFQVKININIKNSKTNHKKKFSQ